MRGDSDEAPPPPVCVVGKNAEAAILQALARDGTRKSRTELARSIVGVFGRLESDLGQRESAIAYDILHKIVLDIEIEARRDIATILAVQHDAPRALIRMLANDEVGVAFPVLAKSGVLNDTDLLDVIQSRTAGHWLAIASRTPLSELVSDALVGTDSEEAIVVLLRNKSAEISMKTMGHLVDRSRDVVSYHEPILVRDDLDPDLALRMFFWVSTVLRDHIVEKFRLDRKIVDDLVGQVIMNEVRRVTRGEEGHRERLVKLKRITRDEGPPTADMLIIALREGEISLFVTLFSRMTSLDEDLIERILFDRDGKGLAVACRSANIGRIATINIFALAQKMLDRDNEAIHRRLIAALDFCDILSHEMANEVLNHWRRGAGYVNSIRTIENKPRKPDH